MLKKNYLKSSQIWPLIPMAKIEQFLLKFLLFQLILLPLNFHINKLVFSAIASKFSNKFSAFMQIQSSGTS